MTISVRLLAPEKPQQGVDRACSPVLARLIIAGYGQDNPTATAQTNVHEFECTVPYLLLSAMGPAVGRAIGRQPDVAFRAIVRGSNVVNQPKFFRLVSGEPYPLGNCAVLSARADLASACTAVKPLLVGAMHSAVLFPDMEVSPEFGAHLSERGYATAASSAMGVDIASVRRRRRRSCEFVRAGDGLDGEEWVRQLAVGYEFPLGVAQCFSPVSLRASTSADS
jgi:hypothetical protein